MNALNNIKIGVKLIVSFIFLAIISGVVGAVGIVNIRTIDDNDTKLYQNMTIPIEQLGQITDHFQKMRVAMRDMLLATNAQDMEKFISDIETERGEIERISAEFEALILSDVMRQAYNDFVSARNAYRPFQLRIVELARAGQRDEAIALMRGDALQAANAEEESIAKMLVMKIEDAKETSDNNTVTANGAVNTMGAMIAVAVLISMVFGVVLSNSITGPLSRGVMMMQELSQGHLGDRLNMDRKDEIGILARAMDQFADDLQKRVVANIKKIAVGDLNVQIIAKDDRDEISPALMGTVQSISGLVVEMNSMSAQQDAGDLDAKMDVSHYSGSYRIMAQGVNDMVFGHITVKRKAMACVAEFGRGNFDAPLERFPGKKVFINDTIEEVRENLKSVSAETRMLSKAGVEGRLSTRANVSKFKGDWATLVQGMNDTLDAVIGPLNVAATYVDRISRGDIPARITDNYNGDFNTIKNNLNQAIDAVNLLVADAGMLAKAGIEGRLATRADASKHQGDYRKIVQGVNETLDSVIGPLNVAASYVDSIAQGVIPPAITDRYNGDFEILKNNLNRLSASLREMLNNMDAAASSLNSAAAEILAATTQQASGASEQSASISETTTTVNEVKVISEQASIRAQEVANASQKTVEVARNGQRSVQDTIESMAMIKEQVEGISENLLALSDQTQQIGEIIATVNEIASQSNMLALNASVEAARAGEHGKGFSVVAVEVRSLAEQSRNATAQVKAILSEIQKATNTTVMATEEGTKGVERGVQLAAQAREAIEQLSAVISESAQIATQVVAGGQQQQTGMEQISLAMSNINQATVQSLASTRQAEKSAQNLNELARQMAELVGKYRR